MMIKCLLIINKRMMKQADKYFFLLFYNKYKIDYLFNNFHPIFI